MSLESMLIVEIHWSASVKIVVACINTLIWGRLNRLGDSKACIVRTKYDIIFDIIQNIIHVNYYYNIYHIIYDFIYDMISDMI